MWLQWAPLCCVMRKHTPTTNKLIRGWWPGHGKTKDRPNIELLACWDKHEHLWRPNVVNGPLGQTVVKWTTGTLRAKRGQMDHWGHLGFIIVLRKPFHQDQWPFHLIILLCGLWKMKLSSFIIGTSHVMTEQVIQCVVSHINSFLWVQVQRQ